MTLGISECNNLKSLSVLPYLKLLLQLIQKENVSSKKIGYAFQIELLSLLILLLISCVGGGGGGGAAQGPASSGADHPVGGWGGNDPHSSGTSLLASGVPLFNMFPALDVDYIDLSITVNGVTSTFTHLTSSATTDILPVIRPDDIVSASAQIHVNGETEPRTANSNQIKASINNILVFYVPYKYVLQNTDGSEISSGTYYVSSGIPGTVVTSSAGLTAAHLGWKNIVTTEEYAASSTIMGPRGDVILQPIFGFITTVTGGTSVTGTNVTLTRSKAGEDSASITTSMTTGTVSFTPSSPYIVVTQDASGTSASIGISPTAPVIADGTIFTVTIKDSATNAQTVVNVTVNNSVFALNIAGGTSVTGTNAVITRNKTGETPVSISVSDGSGNFTYTVSSTNLHVTSDASTTSATVEVSSTAPAITDGTQYTIAVKDTVSDQTETVVITVNNVYYYTLKYVLKYNLTSSGVKVPVFETVTNKEDIEFAVSTGIDLSDLKNTASGVIESKNISENLFGPIESWKVLNEANGVLSDNELSVNSSCVIEPSITDINSNGKITIAVCCKCAELTTKYLKDSEIVTGTIALTNGQYITKQTLSDEDWVKDYTVGVVCAPSSEDALGVTLEKFIVGLKNGAGRSSPWATGNYNNNQYKWEGKCTINISGLILTLGGVPYDNGRYNGYPTSFSGLSTGKDSLSILQSATSATSDSYLAAYFPAWSWFKNYASTYDDGRFTDTDYEDGWYLPAVPELYALFKNQNAINTSIYACGGTIADEWYLTCNQSDKKTDVFIVQKPDSSGINVFTWAKPNTADNRIYFRAFHAYTAPQEL